MSSPEVANDDEDLPVSEAPDEADQFDPDVPRARPARRSAIVALIGALLLVVVGGLSWALWPTPTVRVIAVGDMSCDRNDPDFANGLGQNGMCVAKAVSDLAIALKPEALLGLGDYQYEVPRREDFEEIYAQNFGRLRGITIPAVGNQEYRVSSASTFSEYFAAQLPSVKTYWAQQVGGWRVIVLDSNCSNLKGGCAMGSPQQVWLDDELTRNPARCTLAMWHHPRWSNGIIGTDRRTDALVRTLYAHHADVILAGHEAQYERFPRLNPEGQADKQGLVQFVVGTGGQAMYTPSAQERLAHAKSSPPKSAFVDFTQPGVLELDLKPTGWSWAYHSIAGNILDAGSDTCTG